MTIHNMEVANCFNKVANLLEIEGANPFRVRAYRTAARIINSLSKNISDLVKQGEDLSQLPGIGKDLAEKITIFVTTGSLPLLKEIEARTPPLLNELMRIEGLGPKRIQIIYKKLKIKNISDLKDAIEKGRLQKLKGFGEKIEQKILLGISHVDQYGRRIKLADTFPIVNSLERYLKNFSAVYHVDCAGSFRRRKETIADLDFVVCAKEGKKIIDYFVKYDEIAEVLSQGTTRSTVRLHSGVQVDLRVVPKESYGAALLYFTGSKDHNITIRRIAVKKKLKINEYGVFKGKKLLAGRTEQEMYATVNLPYIEPELREDRGEIEAARANQLPKLVTLADIRGDLHCHTDVTDGKDSLETMAKAAEALGYEYLAITDHSKHLAMIKGLDKTTLLKQMKQIDKLNTKLKSLVILKSIEVDILEDGRLDLENDILKELDFVVGSIHSKFNLSQQKQTERILRAMDNPYLTILGHPTGRLINQREPYDIHIEKIIAAARDHGCILELDAQPDRLDINAIHCKLAKEMGVNIAISSDAHSVSQLNNMQFGVFEARRGWLEKKNVVNTLPLSELRKQFRK